MLNDTELMDLYKSYTDYLKLLDNPHIEHMINVIGERLLMSSYTLRKDEPYCGPGGVIKFAVDSFKIASKMANSFKTEMPDISKKTIAMITLLFPIGRIGDLENNLFIEQKSDWHRDKLGQLYDWNSKCPKMSAQHRTLNLLQYFGVKLEYDEMLGIICSGGMHLEENKFYLHSLPFVTHLCVHAIDLTYEKEKLLNTK